ncbi:MAG: dihydropteroate synthase [Flavobacteriales bacterium]|nr:dihydropteroate synthase [Flavobacteriales bacterium]
MSFHSIKTIQVRGRILDFSTPKVMGIVNITPDSFYDGGQFAELDKAIEYSQKSLNEGADILDIGGASSRPGSKGISLGEEADRIIPLIETLRERNSEVIISVDTYRSEIAKLAINAGADIINDISAGELDDRMISTVAELKVPYIIMHMQGRPETMQVNPEYEDIVLEVTNYLSQRLARCTEAGITDVILDPGFGFGKSVIHNYRLLEHLEHLQLFGRPILVGLSRKSMIQKVLNVDADNALNGTSALHMIALERGAAILRAHDVKEAVECVKLFKKLKSSHG